MDFQAPSRYFWMREVKGLEPQMKRSEVPEEQTRQKMSFDGHAQLHG
jgi:hypothetical protein